jgi:membrane protease YdiL (CAAX protease family)
MVRAERPERSLTLSARNRFLAGTLVIGILPFALNGWYNPVLAQWPLIFWAADLLTFALLPCSILWLVLHRRLATPGDLGFRTALGNRGWFYTLLTLLVVPGVLVVTYTVASGLANALLPHSKPLTSFSYGEMLRLLAPLGWPHLAALGYAAVSAGLTEELYCRSMLLRLFPNTWPGSVAYVLISALLFASVHWEGGSAAIFRTGCFGLLAAILYRAIKNIWPFALAHTVVDLVWLR